MAQFELLTSKSSSAAAEVMPLGTQTMSSLFANIVHVYRHHSRVIFFCGALPTFPLSLLLEVLNATAPNRASLAALLYLLGVFVVSGVLTVALSDICLGNRPTVRRSYERIFGGNRWWHVISTTLMYTLSVSLGLVLLILPGLWLAVRGIFSAIIVAAEGRRNRDAIRRSFALTKGQAWRIIGLTLPPYVLMWVLSVGLAILALKLPAMAAFVVNILGNVVLPAVLTPALALTMVLLYYDQRVRRESYDAHMLAKDLIAVGDIAFCKVGGDIAGIKIASPARSPAEPVFLGVAVPRQTQIGSSFTARFAAYIEAAKAVAQEHLQSFGEKDDRLVTDIPPDYEARWRIGAPITVRLSGEHVTVTPSERSFKWNGRENLASFSVAVSPDAPQTMAQLCYHVFLGPLEIAFIPIGVAISSHAGDDRSAEIEVRTPSSAFASYASKDAEAVARSLSTLAHWAPTLDIFQDCLDLKPNESFKPALEAEIAARDVFLLFWSRNASASKWVRWELATARAKHAMDSILPMPLEDPAIAPPPPGFEDRHLRDRFLIAGYGLRKIAETAGDNNPNS